MYKKLIILPKNATLDKIVDNLKQYPFFANYIRVLNSTYLPIAIKGGHK